MSPMPEGQRYDILGDNLVEIVDQCTCGTGTLYPHEQYCGIERIGSIEEILADAQRAQRLAREITEIRGTLDRVPVYEGLVDSSPLAMLVSELVRDHGELETRIDTVLHLISGLQQMGTWAIGSRELAKSIVAILRGAPRVPDTPEGLDG